jgi:hypothetical protein
MTPKDARRAAHIELGGVEQIKEMEVVVSARDEPRAVSPSPNTFA